MKWVRRECLSIDRIACPWPVARFIDNDSEFQHAAAGRVPAMVVAAGAVSWNVSGVELGHVGERCNFDIFIRR